MSSPTRIIEYGIVDDEKQLPYHNRRYLGKGRSGYVHEVQHQDTNAWYAEKTLRVSGQPRDDTEETFLNEVRIIRGLESHRHIVRVHATYLSTMHFGILLEPVASDRDLEAYLDKYVRQRNGATASCSFEDMGSVLQRGFGCLAAGLAFIHEKRVRHKDIKPRNILVHNGVLLYTDFGYSWDSSGLDTSMTEGPPSGITRKFSAPEILKPEQRNSKSDVYSLGCVFIIILSALNPTLAFDSRQHFSNVMDDIHTQLGSMTLPNEIAALPAIITAMTDREASSRLCAAHATCHLLQHPNLCCSQCASSENKDWTARGKDDECVPPAVIRTNGVLQQGSGSDLDPVVPTSSGTAHKTGAVRHFQDALSPLASQHIDSRNPNDRLGPESARSEPSTTLVPGQRSVGHRVRTDTETTDFFRQGRVFSVLQSEVVSSHKFPRDAVSVDRAPGAQGVQPVARRYVIVKTSKKQQCSYACEISTYGNRGTLASDCNASEHSVVYVQGTDPVYRPGEREKGLHKEPIAIELEDQTIRYEPTSRLNFGRESIFPWTALVQLHGSVSQTHMSRLIGYYREEHNNGFE